MTGVDLKQHPDLDDRYRKILETTTPYLVTYPGNLSALDLSPFGVTVEDATNFDPTRLRSRAVIDGLHHLDAFSFGDQDMLMPRWVLFDCGEFPGIVFGFGRHAKDCDAETRAAYKVEGADHDDDFVPLSMWVALRCAEEGGWFGHNLSSANLVMKENPLPGLATITKALGVKLAKVSKQYGATQWTSSSLNIHMSLGKMRVLNAYTPAHTHPETFTYRIDTTDDALIAPLLTTWKRPVEGGDRHLDADAPSDVRQLHDEIEGGLALDLLRVEKKSNGENRLWLNRA